MLLQYICMKIEEYNETILVELKSARNRDDVEHVMNRFNGPSGFQDLHRFLLMINLHLLDKSLGELFENDFDAAIWLNIRYALVYLIKMNNSLKKRE